MDNLTHEARLRTTSLEAVVPIGAVLPVENPQTSMEVSNAPYQPSNSPVLSPPVLNTGLAIGVIFALSYFVKALSVLVHPPR